MNPGVLYSKVAGEGATLIKLLMNHNLLLRDNDSRQRLHLNVVRSNLYAQQDAQ